MTGAPTVEQAVAWMRDLLAELGTDAGAALSLLLEGRKVAGPYVPAGPHAKGEARHSFAGRLGSVFKAEGSEWGWTVEPAAYGETAPRGPGGRNRAPNRIAARAMLDAALKGEGWTCMASPEPVEERTALQQALDYCIAHPGSEVWLVVADRQRRAAAITAMRSYPFTFREGEERFIVRQANALDRPSHLQVLRAGAAVHGQGFDFAVVSGDGPNVAPMVEQLRYRARTAQSEVRWLPETPTAEDAWGEVFSQAPRALQGLERAYRDFRAELQQVPMPTEPPEERVEVAESTPEAVAAFAARLSLMRRVHRALQGLAVFQEGDSTTEEGRS